MENYFAKFMNVKRPVKRAEAEGSTSSTAKGAIKPTGLSAFPSSNMTDVLRVSVREKKDCMPDDECTAEGANHGRASEALNDVLSGRPTEVLSPVSGAPQVMEQEQVLFRRSEGFETAPISPTDRSEGGDVGRETAGSKRDRETSDEDEDELRLLLGSQEAKRIQEHRLRENRREKGENRNGGVRQTLPSPVAISELPWASRKREDIRRIARFFTMQQQREIAFDASLLEAFSPFLKPRFANKIEESHCVAQSSPESVFHTHPVHLCRGSWEDDEDAWDNRNICSKTTSTADHNPYQRYLAPFTLFKPAPDSLSPDLVNPPASSSGFSLRPYQVDGVAYVLKHFHCGLSCIVSDDMGLGKTAQISAFLHVLAQLHGIHGPHLIICPMTTLTNWMRELSRWAPELKVLKYHGDRDERCRQQMEQHHRIGVVLTTPAILNQDKSFFLRRTWVVAAVDEAHVLKNSQTRITGLARKLSSCFRIAVTGTPVQNDTKEVWSILSFLYPDILGSKSTSEDDDLAESVSECAGLLSHIMIRRTKEQLLLGIPPRVDHPVTLLEPSLIQRELLSLLASGALESADSALQGHLTHQRMACSHPLSLLLTANGNQVASKPAEDGDLSIQQRLEAAGIPFDDASIINPSAKMRYLDSVLPSLKAEGHRCLIFSNFTSVLDLLEGMCVLRGFSYERLDGSSKRVERELSLLRFNNAASSCFIFLVTTAAGGVGITLTGADTVFIFDANFNPQLDRQAADRAHRIGQTREVHVHRLCLQHTVEEYIREVSEYKARLGDMIVNAGAAGPCSSPASSPLSMRTNVAFYSKDSAGSATISGQDIRKMFERLQEHRQRRQENHHGSTAMDGGKDEAHAVDMSRIVDGTPFINGTPEEVALIQRVLAAERQGGEGKRSTTASPSSGVSRVHSFPVSSKCFVCGEKMFKMEAMYHCSSCPKAYHAECVGERKPKPGFPAPRHWSCPRHHCTMCGKAAKAADGAIFMCEQCPRSFCLDCLPPYFLELDKEGANLCHVKRQYDGMDAEGVTLSHGYYYLRCMRCSGMESESSASSSFDESDEDFSEGESEKGSDEAGGDQPGRGSVKKAEILIDSSDEGV